MTLGHHRISVVGTGYLGATHAICMAALGHDVIAVDVDAAKIAALRSGHVPFYEPRLGELLAETMHSGRLRFSTDIAAAGRFADVHFICVGTPQAAGSDAADLSYVFGAIDALAPHLRPGALVVGKSTVPVGTAAAVSRRIAELAHTDDVGIAWNPEFLREGFAVADTLRPDRLVFGVESPEGERVLRDVYEPVTAGAGIPIVVTDLTTAELVKVAANSFLATKISYINAMAEICEHLGGNVLALTEALSHDSRIGARFLRPGLGFGGGCLPKDIRAFRHRAEELGIGQSVAFLDAVDAINQRCRSRVVAAVEAAVGPLPGVQVAALGAAFKPDSDDIRDSPALAVARALTAEGASVMVFDPRAMDNARRAYPELWYARSALDAIAGSNVVLLLTEWKEFTAIDPHAAAAVAAGRVVIDARHALPADEWRAAGWRYLAPGTPEQESAALALADLAS
jgi:UDPglucose 6-dehydrogenase